MRSKPTRGWVTVLAVAAFVNASGVAQVDKTDEYIQAQMQEQRAVGLSLVVLKGGEIVKVRGYGVADRQRKTPITPDTVFKIGSVSKQFIATGILLLRQEGRLSVDDPISKYLAGTPAAWSPITIRHLLTHTAGLVRESPAFDPFKIQRDADVIKAAYGLPLLFAPGEQWEYSNLGYFALAEIITVVAGRPWSAYLDEKLFKPVGMTATRPTATRDKIANMATGYSDNDRHLLAQDWPAVRPSGAFLSTARDMAKWDAALHTDAVLTEATRRQMWTPVTLNDGRTHGYGFGWHVGTLNGRRAVYHGGGLPGFVSQFLRFVDDRVSVFLTMNLDDADPEGIAVGVAALHLPPARVLPSTAR